MNSLNRPFAVFDIDGTLIRWQLYHAITDQLAINNIIPKEQYNKIKQARLDWKNRLNNDSYIKYENIMIEFTESNLINISPEEYFLACQAILKKYKDQVYSYTRNLIINLKNKNYILFALSGSPDEIIKPLTQYYKFDDYCASTRQIINGRYSGKTNIMNQHNKFTSLQSLILKHQVAIQGSIAVGDSQNDIKMMSLTEHPIAFNPNRQLADHAKTQQWPIVIERKNVIYELDNHHGSYVLA